MNVLGKSTLDEMWHPLMAAPSIKLPYCAICGRTSPRNEHHMVFRSSGNLFDERGRKMPKPTITLCGFGNNLHDADGREYCHGLAHHKRLHFRWVASKDTACAGHLEYLLLDEPCDYLDALSMPGWKRLP